jgi:polyisoprenoid-binding protein YceI
VAQANSSAAPAAPSAEAAREVKYTFSSPTSQIVFVARDAQGKHEGSFGKFSGSIAVKNGDPEQGSVTVDIDMTSVQGGDPKLTRALKSPGFLDTTKFPEAHFVSQSVRNGGELGATDTVTGTLELHGVRKLIDVPATLHVRPNGVDVDAELSLSLKDFGLGSKSPRAARVEDAVVLQLLVVAVPTP